MSKYIVTLLMILLPVYSYASGYPSVDNFNLSDDNGATISVIFKDLKTNNTVYSKNENKFLRPASGQKLITAFAALSILPENYVFLTSIFLDKKGDLYIKFTGDPKLTRDELRTLLTSLKGRKLSGNVIIDKSAFEDQEYAEGWIETDTKFCFGGAISAAMIDSFCTEFTYNNNLNRYEPSLTPSFIDLDNDAEVVNKAIDCDLDLVKHRDNKYKLSGCYTTENAPPLLNIAVTDSTLYVVDVIKDIFKSYDLPLHSISISTVPDGLSAIAFHSSLTLKELIREMLKISDNQIAESLFKAISFVKEGQGSWKKSKVIVEDLLYAVLGDSAEGVQIYDGSGLSYYNLMKASLFTDLLLYIHSNSALYQSIIDSLPNTITSDGTLRKRFKNTEYYIFAKTGSMKNISSLSGFICDNTRKNRFAFSVIINNYIAPYGELKAIEESIINTALNEILTSQN